MAKKYLFVETDTGRQGADDGPSAISGSVNSVGASGAGGTSIGASETLVGSVTITTQSASSKVLVLARAEFTKDNNTTRRTVTARVKRGSTQVGQDSVHVSRNVALTIFGPCVVLAVDTPGVEGAVQYDMQALVNSASTATSSKWEILAVELLVPAGEDGVDGADGASAYEVAVANGFVGDEAAWLASLEGEPGTPGTDGAGLSGGAWKVFYTDGDGDLQELALGADGTVLQSNGPSAAPSFEAPGGGGGGPDVTVIANKNGSSQSVGGGGWGTVTFGNEVADPNNDFASDALNVASGEVWIYTGAITVPGSNTGNWQGVALFKDGSFYRRLNVIGHWTSGNVTIDFHTLLTEPGDYTLRTTTQSSTNHTVSGDTTETYLIARRLK